MDEDQDEDLSREGAAAGEVVDVNENPTCSSLFRPRRECVSEARTTVKGARGGRGTADCRVHRGWGAVTGETNCHPYPLAVVATQAVRGGMAPSALGPWPITAELPRRLSTPRCGRLRGVERATDSCYYPSQSPVEPTHSSSESPALPHSCEPVQFTDSPRTLSVLSGVIPGLSIGCPIASFHRTNHVVPICPAGPEPPPAPEALPRT